ncbi:MAG: phage terminase large subunit [Beijerinckiaceae bacterium]
MIDHRELLLVHLRNDLVLFTMWAIRIIRPDRRIEPTWVHDAICQQLLDALEGRSRRVIVNMPPRTLKSTIVNVAFVAWVMGRNPAARFICASYSEELARTFSRDFRRLVEHPLYQAIFPNMRIDKRKNTEGEIATTANGYRIATSVGGTLTGRGADYLIVDDPLNAIDAHSLSERTRVQEWFTQSLITRLDDQRGGAIVVVMQRLHEDDLSGYLLRTSGWTHLKLGVRNGPEERVFALTTGKRKIWMPHEDLLPGYLPRSVQHEIQRGMNEAAFHAQFMQEPRPATGNVIRTAWLERRSAPPPRDRIVAYLHSWDVATKTTEKHDWTVMTHWAVTRDNTYYLLDVVRVRLEFPDLLRLAESRLASDRPNYVLVEDAGNGASLIQVLSKNLRVTVVAIRPDRDKLTRLVRVSPVLERGGVVLPESAPWTEAYIQELTSFPNGRFDDQVDSTTQALNWADEKFRVPVLNLDPNIDFNIGRKESWLDFGTPAYYRDYDGYE